MFIRKFAVTIFATLAFSAAVVAAAPVAVENNHSGLSIPPTRGSEGTIDKDALSGQEASAFALFKEKPATEIVDRKSKSGFMSIVPLPPALLLFGGALGAIFWLGRRRKSGGSDFE